MKRVDVSALFVIPEVIFYKNFDSNLSFGHARIIDDEPRGETDLCISGFSFFVGKYPQASTILIWEG